MKKVRRIFSESVKRESVRQIEMGQKTCREVAELYGLSQTAVRKWKKKYGILPKAQRVVVESDSDYAALKSSQKQIADLERSLGKLHMEVSYLREVIKEASLNYSEDIEKKFGKQ